MVSERLIEKCVIGINQFHHTTVILEEIDVETCDFLLHGLADQFERWEVAFALFIKCRHIANMQVLAAEFRRQTSNSIVLEHPAHLSRQDCWISQLARSGSRPQFIIRYR